MEFDDLDDLLVSDKGSGGEKENSKPQKIFEKKKQSLIINQAPINLDKSTDTEKDEKINISSKNSNNIEQKQQIYIPLKTNDIKQENKPAPKTNNLLDFVIGGGTIIPDQTNKSSHPKQFIHSNPSSFSKESLDNNIKQIQNQNKVSLQSSSILQQPLPQVNETNATFDERKMYENYIVELNKQKMQIESEYLRAIKQKKEEYTFIEARNKKEKKELEKKYDNKINTKQEIFKENEEKLYKQKNKIEEDKIFKIKSIKESQEKLYNHQLEQLESEFKIEKEKIEAIQKYELDNINMELENIKERKNKILKDEISNKNIYDIYNELYNRINSLNNDVELNIKLKEKEFLQKDLESRNKQLSEEIRKIKENEEEYNNRISKKNEELEEIKEKIEKEIKDLKNKEYEINRKQLDIKNYYDKIDKDLEDNEKYMKNKFDEERNIYDLNQEIKEENILNEDKELFEKEKKNIYKILEERNKELNNKSLELKQYELRIENNLAELNSKEDVIIRDLNEISNLNEDITLEKEKIQRERYNIELIEKRIQNDIKLLNEDKDFIEKEKEKIKRMNMEIEDEKNKLNNEYKILEQENQGLDLKSQTLDNMRLNYILNNKYQNNRNNFEDIGLKTMPNFVNNIINNNISKNNNGANFNRTDEFKHKDNFAKTFSIFNQGDRKLNAEEYFEKLNKEIEDKKKVNGDNEYDINNYIINGKNFIKEIREESNFDNNN